jgi:membrane-bound serine protease (ClpP class)
VAAVLGDTLSADTKGSEAPDVSSRSDALVYRVPIEGIIDLGLAPFVERAVQGAAESGAGAVLLDINTFGGRVDAAVKIRDALVESPVRTIAYVNPRAISAGAMISIACHSLVMAPGATIGAATPVTAGSGGEMEAADEKVTSYMRAEMRATAERRGRRADIAEAMVDRDGEIEGVIEGGKLLTLTTRDALSWGFADYEASSITELLEREGLPDARVVELRSNWAENFARVVSHPALSSLLLSIGFLGIMIELYQPGWGIPGTVGLVCLGLFFLGHYVVRLAGLEEILLFVVGVALLSLEVFVIPGFGVAGILGGLALLVSVILALLGLEWRVSWELGLLNEALTIVAGSVVIFAVGAFLVFKFLPRAPVARRLVLERGLEKERSFTSHDPGIEERFPPGTRAVATSDLRPAGRIRVEGRRLDAMTEGGFLENDTEVVITEWREGTAVVRRAPESEP